MAPSAEPAAELARLGNADGSATFSHGGFTVAAAVNGPIEAPRRDEKAFEALVDVNVRPAAGVGGRRTPSFPPFPTARRPGRRLTASVQPPGTAERRLESILQAALRQLIPVRSFPRCMVQVTLQVLEVPVDAYAATKLLQAQPVGGPPSPTPPFPVPLQRRRGIPSLLPPPPFPLPADARGQNAALLPALLHAAVLGLARAAVPLKTMATATTVATGMEGREGGGASGVVVGPGAGEAARARGLHVLGFTSDGKLVLAESAGSFSAEEWGAALEAGRAACCPGGDDDAATGVGALTRSALEAEAAAGLHWR